MKYIFAKAIDLVHSEKFGEYTLAKKDIQNITRISTTKQKETTITTEPKGKAKVNKGEYSNTHQYKCKGCSDSFKTKNDLVHHVRQTHKHNTCLTRNKVLWGDRELNDHTKQCREKNVTKQKNKNQLQK